MAEPHLDAAAVARAARRALRREDEAGAAAVAALSAPPHLRGLLAGADALRPGAPPAPAEASAPFTVDRLIFRGAPPERRPLHTGPNVLEVLARDVRAARTLGAAQRAVGALRPALMATGAFKGVTVHEAAGSGGPNSVDLVVELDERAYSLSTGVTQSLAGAVRGGTQASLINALGQAETLSASVGSASGEVSFAGITDMLPGAFGGSGGQGAGAGAGFGASSTRAKVLLEQLSTPTFTLSLHKPTFLAAPTPVDVRLRSELEFHDAQSGFVNAVREAEATLTDSTGRHSVSYACAWRNLTPVRQPRSLFASGSSAAIAANCDSSLKSSVAYSFLADALNDARAPTAGSRALFRAELAGAGGDVQFAKAAFSGVIAASALRFAPDTGFALPLPRNAGVAAAAGGGSEGLRPHPGTGLFGLWGRALSGSLRASDPPVLSLGRPTAGGAAERAASFLDELPAKAPAPLDYSLGQRLAGWLAPGVTAHLELSLGALVPYGRSAQQPPRGGASSRVPDRFFLFGSKCRGFESVGPRAAPVVGGTLNGDALGGDALVALAARLLLPPPFPSVRLANFGVRSQLFATVASLGSASDLFKLGTASASASAGLGVYVPVVAGASVELNWALWHRQASGASDVKAGFRIQMSS